MNARNFDPSDFSWAIPFMRAGYAGRGLMYLVIAGFSLYAIWRGGQAQGTSQAMERLETTSWGGGVLAAIAIGMAAYAIWRLVDAAWDLELYGTEAKGVVARLGMVVTGLIHLALGIAAASLAFTGNSGGSGGGSSGGSGGGGSTIAEAVGAVMQAPGGPWIVGAVGVVTAAAGAYYVKKAVAEDYQDSLRSTETTRKLNPALKAGVLAQGVVVLIVGGLLVWAAITTDPSQAGGLGRTFSWLSGQTYGQVLVTALCVGLLGFSLFCFVNALYRIVPKAAGDDIASLAGAMRRATG